MRASRSLSIGGRVFKLVPSRDNSTGKTIRVTEYGIMIPKDQFPWLNWTRAYVYLSEDGKQMLICRAPNDDSEVAYKIKDISSVHKLIATRKIPKLITPGVYKVVTKSKGELLVDLEVMY